MRFEVCLSSTAVLLKGVLNDIEKQSLFADGVHFVPTDYANFFIYGNDENTLRTLAHKAEQESSI